ncbi:MAG: 1-acyl-sn-glycerol-3-phosphate acyltransferase [Gemmatimonadetes bacterium]|nr:1-acyl-sn-glycerol-3-phosphate acyltransferase [Gemmatimonadota bacterium]
MIGLLRVALVAVPLTILYASRLIWASWRRSATLRRLSDDYPRRWSGHLLRAAGTRVELVGGEVIDPGRAQILVANHVSWFDILAVAASLPGSVRFIAKKELTKVPLFGRAWQAAGHIPIDRHDRNSAMDSLEVARRRLEEDRPTVVFFPEGTRSPTGELRGFKKGAFILAIQTGVEVVPAAILGSREVMPKGSWRIRTGRTIRVRLGAPIPVDGLTIDDRDVLMGRARDAVAELLGGERRTGGENQV